MISIYWQIYIKFHCFIEKFIGPYFFYVECCKFWVHLAFDIDIPEVLIWHEDQLWSEYFVNCSENSEEEIPILILEFLRIWNCLYVQKLDHGERDLWYFFGTVHKRRLLFWTSSF